MTDEIDSLRQQLEEVSTAIKQCQLQHALTIKELDAMKEEQEIELNEPDWIQRAMQAEAELDAIKGKQDPVALNAREIELIDGIIEVQLYHAERCDKIQNRTMAEKQKGWDMERVELLRKLKSGMSGLYLHPAPIPEGWQLVPIEPTGPMIAAFNREFYKREHSFSQSDCYRAMLAASPKWRKNHE